MNSVEQWRNPRFGAIVDGVFVPLGPEDEAHPEAHRARWIGGATDFDLATAVAKDLERATSPVAIADLPAFPTMLRKMWSGTEVQQWIDDCLKPLFQERHFSFHCDTPTAWQIGNPDIAEGTEREFVAAVRRKHNGKVYVVSATFANKYDDEMIDRDGETFIADGWFTCGADMSGEVSSVYAPLLESGDEVLGWQSLPIWGPAAGSKREAAPVAVGDAKTEQVEIPQEVIQQQESLNHPVTQVFFRAGLLACREYMARFVELESPTIAASIRANWWPSLGQDFGPPRKLNWNEFTEGEYGESDFRVLTADEVSPTQEALPIALQFLVPADTGDIDPRHRATIGTEGIERSIERGVAALASQAAPDALTDAKRAIGDLRFIAKTLNGSGDFNTASRIATAVDAIAASQATSDTGTVRAVIAEMIEVATAERDESDFNQEWTADNCAQIDKWQSRSQVAIAGVNEQAAPSAPDAQLKAATEWAKTQRRGWLRHDELLTAYLASKASPDAQQASEPVAWLHAKAQMFVIGGRDKQPFAKGFVPLYATPQPAPAALTDEQIRTVEHAATKLENIGHIFSGDKESRRLGQELKAILAAQPVSAADAAKGEQS